MSDLEILMQESEGKEITIRNDKFFIGKLKSGKTFKLLAKCMAIIFKNVKRFTDLKDGKSNEEDAANIISKLDENELFEIVSIIIEKDIEYCKELYPDEVLDIVATTVEYNKDIIKRALKNWQRITNQFKSNGSQIN